MYDYTSDGFMDEDDEDEFVYSEEESDVESGSLANDDNAGHTQQSQSQVGYSEEAGYDDDDYYGGETGDFDSILAAHRGKKSWEVEFKVHNEAELSAKQDAIVARLEPVLATSKDTTTLLLRCYFWKEDPLVEDYLMDPDRMMSKAGVSINQEDVCIRSGDADFVCEICYNEGSNEEFLVPSCGHRYCTTCYRTYLAGKVHEGGSWRIRCPAPKCGMLVGTKAARLLLESNKDDLARYNHNLTRSFVNDRDSFVWCPAPNCEFAIECQVPRSAMTMVVPTVTCKCGNRFCFGCQLPDHMPAPCHLASTWLDKCKDDSETASWIKVNTKECTKCKATIEKNGGCNHMSCRECRYEFCWVCMGPWAEHGQHFYNCNRFNESSSKDARDSISETRAQLERYIHYFTRYNNHEQSAKLARKLLATTEKNMDQLQRELTLSWIEVQFLSDAVDILSICRSTLKWTYVLAFFMKPDNQNQMVIFENNQSDLEMATEQLNDLVENPTSHGSIEDIKRKIIDKSTYVKSRRETLLSDTAAGLQENRWTFSI
ncbi:hypothetical protein LPJ66_006599 [Kickxella alabastrina]|uniref:Uncharacterized protein n=1 Tax=Kickxella alabastrina TaxID=61397 RepID=A0ACC1IBF7_9FUNG|nr:hypothetical protein LPJ66_006599 [Kickxella alabastrina]